MSKNIYDIFRTTSKKRATSFNTRSAAFITEGRLSKDIFHKRKNKFIKAGLTYQYKEGPDEVIVYTFEKDQLRKGDYFVYNNLNYLIFEDQKLTDEKVNHKKQRALECNVSFEFKGTIYKGYFLSSLRRRQMPNFQGKEILMPNEMPLLILPSNSTITVNDTFKIKSKYWEVKEYDEITNDGITYYYVERFVKETSKEEELIPEFNFIQEEARIIQSEIINELSSLRPETNYIFDTEDFFFTSDPKVDIISRSKDKIEFRVPFGIETVWIETKENEAIILKEYSVVLD